MASGALVRLQTPAQVPVSNRLELASNLLLPPERVDRRLRHFAEGVYDLSDRSHLVRLLKVLLGDAGMGEIRKRLNLARLQQTAEGAHFYDLDRFYGALFGLRRSVGETIDLNPYTGTGTKEEWLDAQARDASYRSRVQQLGRAISYGATPSGMELAAEAVLSVDCDVYEQWIQADQSYQTHAEIAARYATQGDMQGVSHAVLAGQGLARMAGDDRRVFTVVPKRAITASEAHDLLRVLNRLKPADARVLIETRGNPIHSQVPVRSAVADSEHWEIVTKVGGDLPVSPYPDQSTTPVEQPKPPFSGYQGGEWTYNGEVTGVAAYAIGPPDGVTDVVLPPDVVLAGTSIPLGWVTKLIPVQRRFNGFAYVTNPWDKNPQGFRWRFQWVDYPAHAVILGGSLVAAAKAVNDAVMQVQPYAAARESVRQVQVTDDGRTYSSRPVDTSAAPEIYIDGVPATALLSAIQSQAAGLPLRDESEQFWVSPERHATDPTFEFLEVRLSGPKPVNVMTFEVAHFPQHIQVDIFNENTQTWQVIWSTDILTSVPKTVKVATEGQSDVLHPNIAGHWVSLTVPMEAYTTSRVRIGSQRLNVSGIPRRPRPWGPGSGHPKRALGDPVPYSLGLRGMILGYKVTKREDAPVSGVIAVTTDILGSPVQYVIDDEPASNLMIGKPWRCQPQPLPRAVTSLYIDVRDDHGNPEVIDRLFIDPLYTGAHITLYTAGAGRARVPYVEATLPISHLTGAGHFGWGPLGAARLTDHDSSAAAPTDALPSDFPPLAYLDISWEATDGPDNGAEPTAEFTIKTGEEYTVAVEVARKEPAPAVSVDYPVVSTLGLNVTAPGVGGVIATTTHTTDLTIAGWNQIEVTFTAGADGVATFTLTDPSGQPNLGYLVRNFRFVQGDFGGGESEATKPDLAYYEDLGWTPINQDYVAHRGYLTMPPTAAQFIKIEFTNLVAQAYESFLRLVRNVKTFPAHIVGMTLPEGTGVADANLPAGMNTVRSLEVPAPIDHPDSNLAVTLARRAPHGYGHTEAYAAPDPVLREKLQAKSWVYGFMPWAKGERAPRWPYANQPHPYEIVEVNHDAKIAFFAGLKEVRAYRVQYEIPDDTSVYRENFLDADQIDPTSLTWEISAGVMFSGNSVGAPRVAQSRPLESQHPVTAVQFATQQSSPVQVIPDDDFVDPALASSTWLDPDAWHKIGDARLIYSVNDNSVKVLRSVEPITRPLVRTGGLVQRPMQPTFAERPITLVDLEAEASTFGGIESMALATITGTRIHAAVRFTPRTEVVNPVRLQIITANTGLVLAERTIQPAIGQTYEEFIAYDVGSLLAPPPPLDNWAFHGGLARPMVHEPIPDEPANVQVPPPPSGTDPIDTLVKVRLLQQGKDDIELGLDTLSLFDDGMEWDFSVNGGSDWFPARDIRNNDRGVLTFPEPGTQLVWRVKGYRPNMGVTALQIRPWYGGIMNARDSTTHRGPNISTYDFEPPIQDDPMFTSWTKPVPRWWYRLGRQLPNLPVDGVPNITPFRRFFSRTVTETIPTPTISVESTRFMRRSVSEHIDQATTYPNLLTDADGESGTMASWIQAGGASWAADETYPMGGLKSLHGSTDNMTPGSWRTAHQDIVVGEDVILMASFDWALRNVRQSHVKVDFFRADGSFITAWFVAGGTDATGLTGTFHVPWQARVTPKDTALARFSLLVGWAPSGIAETWWDNLVLYADTVNHAVRQMAFRRSVNEDISGSFETVVRQTIYKQYNAIADRPVHEPTGTPPPIGPPL